MRQVNWKAGHLCPLFITAPPGPPLGMLHRPVQVTRAGGYEPQRTLGAHHPALAHSEGRLLPVVEQVLLVPVLAIDVGRELGLLSEYLITEAAPDVNTDVIHLHVLLHVARLDTPPTVGAMLVNFLPI